MDLVIKTTFDDQGFLKESNYWDTELCEKGYYYLAYNSGSYFLLVPENKLNSLVSQIEGSFAVVITKGSYKGKNKSIEIMFDDLSNEPFYTILEKEQVFYTMEMEKGWNGHFYIFAGTAEKYKCYCKNVYYRATDNIPYLMSPEEPFDWGEPAVTIDKQEHFEGHGNRWSAFALSEDEFSDLIVSCIKKGKLLESVVYKKTKKAILPIVYPEKSSIKVCSLNVPKGKKLVLESAFPVLGGIKNEVTIGKKYPWKNEIEGEIEITNINGFDNFIFTPFYKQEFTSVKKGSKVSVYLSGLAYSIQDALMEFEVDKGPLYEQALRDFLRYNPDKDTKDFKNPIVSMEKLISLFPTETHSLYHYRGTILSLKYVNFLGKKIAKTKVCISRDGEKELMHIFLYIPMNVCENCTLEKGKDIMGIIDIQGYCTELDA